MSFLNPDLTPNWHLTLLSLATFGALCFVSSFGYVINDIVDKEKDRQHPVKKKRPLASGRVSIPFAIVISIILLALAIILCLLIPQYTYLAIAAYLAISLFYTFILKHKVIIDVIIIAMGFVIRIIAGSVAINVPFSNWLLLTTLFISLFLGFAKRRHDLSILENKMQHRPVLEHYSIQLLDYMIVIAVTLTIITYSLYVLQDQTQERFGTDKLIYTLPFVLYGLFRYMYIVYKKKGGGDPADIVLRDKSILFVVLLWGISIIVILYLGRLSRGGL